jgi:hypothetical protein
VTSDEVRAAVLRELLGRVDMADAWDTGDVLTMLGETLRTLGGTWELVQMHVFMPLRGRRAPAFEPPAEHTVGCMDPCPFKSGRHEVHRRWTSDPVTT